MWGAEADKALLQEIFAPFQTHYAGQASFQITYQPKSESHCKDVLLGLMLERSVQAGRQHPRPGGRLHAKKAAGTLMPAAFCSAPAHDYAPDPAGKRKQRLTCSLPASYRALRVPPIRSARARAMDSPSPVEPRPLSTV